MQDEMKARDVRTGLVEHGKNLLIEDRSEPIEALPIAAGRIADLHPGQERPDGGGDATMIAEAARPIARWV